MVKPEVIRRRLEKLDEYLSYLEDVQEYDQQKFLANIETWASAERFLQMAVELVNDIASHIIADEKAGTINQYRDIPEIFFEQNWINDELKEKWIHIIGFRNILVHGYATIDRSIVYDIIQNNLKDIKTLKKIFAQFL
jgi:uncharacterized protein YutE (UPF0331/DUF86 family)